MQQPVVHAFFESQSFTYSYLVWDPLSKEAAVIDPVLDFDAASGSTSTSSAEQIMAKVKEHNLTVQWLLETHVHADHLSAAPFLKRQLGGRIAIGSRITEVQQLFSQVFNLKDLKTDGSAFDKLFVDGENFMLGTIRCSVLHTPGHTPACVSYCIGDAVFVGDTLFMPTGMWHWMKYVDGSFSLSLRAWDQSISRKVASVWSLFRHGAVDSLIKMMFKEKYANYREKLAVKRAENAYAKGKL